MLPCKNMRRRFLLLHAIAITLHLGCAGYAFASNASRQTPTRLELRRVRYLTSPEGDFEYYVDARVHEFDGPSVAQLHGIVAFFTAIVHASVYLPIHAFHSNIVWRQGFFLLRWVEYAVSCTIMSISSSITAGTRDINVIVVFVLLGVVLQCIGAIIEQEKRLYAQLFLVGGLVNAASSYSTLWYLFSSYSDFNIVQTLEVAAYAFFYALFPINCWYDAVYRPPFCQTDWIYNILSLTSKFALFWLQVGEVERVLYDGAWASFQIYGLGLVLPLAFLALASRGAPRCEVEKDGRAEEHASAYVRLLGRLARLRITPAIAPPTCVPPARLRRFGHIVRR